MTAAPTPPPVGRPDIAAILRRIEYGSSEEDRAALLAAFQDMEQKVEETRAWGIDLAQDAAAESRRVAEAAAERRVADAEAERDAALTERADFEIGLTLAQADLAAARQQNESLLARLETEREEYREMYERQAKVVRIHTARADAADARVAELQGRLDQSAAYAINHGADLRLEVAAVARENERLRREIDRLRDALGWDSDDPEDNYDLVSGDAALAAEPREGGR